MSYKLRVWRESNVCFESSQHWRIAGAVPGVQFPKRCGSGVLLDAADPVFACEATPPQKDQNQQGSCNSLSVC